MRSTGLGLSAVLVAAGAVMAWAVTYDAEGVDLNQVGIIVFVVGLALGAINLLTAMVGRRTVVESDRESMVDGRPVVQRQREIITEHDPSTSY